MNGISSPMRPQRVLLPLLPYVGTRKKIIVSNEEAGVHQNATTLTP